ncbi:MAG: transposase [Candidatus Nitrosocosmicus sp.]|nr:transposase [Candidatus Nitrosocosmicus sp.]
MTDIFGAYGIEWLKPLLPKVSPVDMIILSTSIESIQTINQQIDTVSKEISNYACRNDKSVRILLSITGVDIFSSAMLISSEIVDVRRFSTPWKLVSYAGLAPSIRESSGKTKNWWNNEARFTVAKVDTSSMCTCRNKIRLSPWYILYPDKEQERSWKSHSCNSKRTTFNHMVHAN